MREVEASSAVASGIAGGRPGAPKTRRGNDARDRNTFEPERITQRTQIAKMGRQVNRRRRIRPARVPCRGVPPRRKSPIREKPESAARAIDLLAGSRPRSGSRPATSSSAPGLRSMRGRIPPTAPGPSCDHPGHRGQGRSGQKIHRRRDAHNNVAQRCENISNS